MEYPYGWNGKKFVILNLFQDDRQSVVHYPETGSG